MANQPYDKTAALIAGDIATGLAERVGVDAISEDMAARIAQAAVRIANAVLQHLKGAAR